MTYGSEYSQDNDPSDPEWSTNRIWAALAILGFGFLLFAGYFVLPGLARKLSCPSDTFMSGSLGEQSGFVFTIFIPFACLVLLFCLAPSSPKRVAATASIKKHVLVYAAAALSALAVATFILANMTLSYFCAAPTAIVIRHGVGLSEERLSWSDVRSVHAHCWYYAAPAGSRTSVYRSGGVLDLSLTDGEAIALQLGTGMYSTGRWGLGLDAENIRRALGGHDYRYTFSDLDRCSTQIYNLFVTWRV